MASLDGGSWEVVIGKPSWKIIKTGIRVGKTSLLKDFQNSSKNRAKNPLKKKRPSVCQSGVHISDCRTKRSIKLRKPEGLEVSKEFSQQNLLFNVTYSKSQRKPGPVSVERSSGIQSGAPNESSTLPSLVLTSQQTSRVNVLLLPEEIRRPACKRKTNSISRTSKH